MKIQEGNRDRLKLKAATWLHLKMEEEAVSQGCKWPPEAGRDKQMNIEPPGSVWLC